MDVVDSSGWLEHFADGPNADPFEAPLTDTGRLVVPTVTVYEVIKVLLRERGERVALQGVAAMSRATVVQLSAEGTGPAAVLLDSRMPPRPRALQRRQASGRSAEARHGTHAECPFASHRLGRWTRRGPTYAEWVWVHAWRTRWDEDGHLRKRPCPDGMRSRRPADSTGLRSRRCGGTEIWSIRQRDRAPRPRGQRHGRSAVACAAPPGGLLLATGLRPWSMTLPRPLARSRSGSTALPHPRRPRACPPQSGIPSPVPRLRSCRGALLRLG